ncbi:hypothetical protein ACHAWF_011362 [Thalassiosira exigua]
MTTSSHLSDSTYTFFTLQASVLQCCFKHPKRPWSSILHLHSLSSLPILSLFPLFPFQATSDVMSFSSTLNAINAYREKERSWSSGPIKILCSNSLLSTDHEEVNITPTLGHRAKCPTAIDRNDTSCLWLPPNLNMNNDQFRKKEIYPTIIRACAAAGFKVGCRYRKERTSIRVECARRRQSDEVKSKEYASKTPRNVKDCSKPPVPRQEKTHRSIKSKNENMPSQSICPFNFNMFWDESHKRWFLPRKQFGSSMHVGHFKIEPQHVRLASKHSLSDPEQQLSLDCYDTGMDNTSTAALIEQRTGSGSLVTWHQLRYMKNKHKNLMLTGDATDNAPTPADRLVRQLSRDPSKSFVALFAEFHSGLVTIKTRSKRQNNSHAMSDFNHDLQDDTDSPIAFAQSLRKRLQASSSGKILLMIAWTSDHSRLQFDEISEFCGIDDTFDTNSEERPLLTVVGRCNQNHIFDILRAFMPSTAKWAYIFLFSFAFPQLHPGMALSKLSHIQTDACPQEISSLENTISLARTQKITCAGRSGDYGNNIPWSNAKNAYCAWHLIDRNFLSDSKYKASICEAKSDSILTRVEIDIIVRWMWYLVKYYVSDEEVEFSFTLLSWYISTED